LQGRFTQSQRTIIEKDVIIKELSQQEWVQALQDAKHLGASMQRQVISQVS